MFICINISVILIFIVDVLIKGNRIDIYENEINNKKGILNYSIIKNLVRFILNNMHLINDRWSDEDIRNVMYKMFDIHRSMNYEDVEITFDSRLYQIDNKKRKTGTPSSFCGFLHHHLIQKYINDIEDKSKIITYKLYSKLTGTTSGEKINLFKSKIRLDDAKYIAGKLIDKFHHNMFNYDIKECVIEHEDFVLVDGITNNKDNINHDTVKFTDKYIYTYKCYNENNDIDEKYRHNDDNKYKINVDNKNKSDTDGSKCEYDDESKSKINDNKCENDKNKHNNDNENNKCKYDNEHNKSNSTNNRYINFNNVNDGIHIVKSIKYNISNSLPRSLREQVVLTRKGLCTPIRRSAINHPIDCNDEYMCNTDRMYLIPIKDLQCNQYAVTPYFVNECQYENNDEKYASRFKFYNKYKTCKALYKCLGISSINVVTPSWDRGNPKDIYYICVCNTFDALINGYDYADVGVICDKTKNKDSLYSGRQIDITDVHKDAKWLYNKYEFNKYVNYDITKVY